jgi:hypothetical protein
VATLRKTRMRKPRGLKTTMLGKPAKLPSVPKAGKVPGIPKMPKLP